MRAFGRTCLSWVSKRGLATNPGIFAMTAPFLVAKGISKALRRPDGACLGSIWRSALEKCWRCLATMARASRPSSRSWRARIRQATASSSSRACRWHFSSPKDAASAGIATIFQELALSENLSISENVFLGRELKRSVLGVPFLRRTEMRQRVEACSRSWTPIFPIRKRRSAACRAASARRSPFAARSI